MMTIVGGLGLAVAIAWTAAVARVGPRGEALLSAGLLLGPIAAGLAWPPARPLLVAGVLGFNVVPAFFLVWGLSSDETTLGGIAALAALAAFGAAVVGVGMLERGEPGALPLLAALPAVAALALARDVALGRLTAPGSLRSNVWMVGVFALPLLLAA